MRKRPAAKRRLAIERKDRGRKDGWRKRKRLVEVKKETAETGSALISSPRGRRMPC